MPDQKVELKQALPYLRLFRGKNFVIKTGGDLLERAGVIRNLAEQVALLHQLGIRVVLVHGGGPQASALAERLGVPVRKVAGRRITDDETLQIAQMVFRGLLSTRLVSAFSAQQVPAVGLSGLDGGLLMAERRKPVLQGDEMVDYGHVGDIVRVYPELLRALLEANFVPIISPLAGGSGGEVYNVNADTVAAEIAVALKAEKLILLTSVAGVLRDPKDPASMISHLLLADVPAVLAGSAEGGMRPKLQACAAALEKGVSRAHIISGLDPEALLVEVFTNAGSGTLIE
jgi:acetylglutamate kinase